MRNPKMCIKIDGYCLITDIKYTVVNSIDSYKKGGKRVKIKQKFI